MISVVKHYYGYTHEEVLDLYLSRLKLDFFMAIKAEERTANRLASVMLPSQFM